MFKLIIIEGKEVWNEVINCKQVIEDLANFFEKRGYQVVINQL